MPIAREIGAVEFGCAGLWLWQRSNGWELATVGILDAINIPCYEKLVNGRTTALWTGFAGGAGIFACYGIADGIIPR